jgi:hypothetical protein
MPRWRGPGSYAARRWLRQRAPAPARPPTSGPSDLLRRSPPHARSSPHSDQPQRHADCPQLNRESHHWFDVPARPIHRQQHAHFVPPISVRFWLRLTTMRPGPERYTSRRYELKSTPSVSLCICIAHPALPLETVPFCCCASRLLLKATSSV